MMLVRREQKTLSSRATHQVTIQTRAQIPDGEGGFSDGWLNRNSQPVWSEIEPMQAKQSFEYRTIGVDATHFIKVDGLIEVEEQDRILYGDRIFEILTIENLKERNAEKFITCLERR